MLPASPQFPIFAQESNVSENSMTFTDFSVLDHFGYCDKSLILKIIKLQDFDLLQQLTLKKAYPT
jgi:hypothetical protein